MSRHVNPKESGAERKVVVEESGRFAISPGDGDGERKAVAFDRGVGSRLTPTIKGFTLEGKVAVVTG